MDTGKALYRIQTENSYLFKRNVVKLADEYFSAGYTIFEGVGHWQGEKEPSLTIEILTDNEAAVEVLAGKIKVYNHQECILLEKLPVEHSFI